MTLPTTEGDAKLQTSLKDEQLSKAISRFDVCHD